MLKSSSTPILGSLVSSLESHNHHHQSHEVHGNTHKHIPTPISYTNGNGVSSHEFRRTLFRSPSLAHQITGFRRVQSDGNLEALALANADDLSFSNKLGGSRRSSISCCTMRPIPPSFEYTDDDDDEEDEKLQDTFNAAMRVQEQVRNTDFMRFGGDEGKMYLATGLGGGNGGRGGSYRPVAFDKGGGMEEHYKKMLEENPGNSLLLRNYAHFLYKVGYSMYNRVKIHFGPITLAFRKRYQIS